MPAGIKLSALSNNVLLSPTLTTTKLLDRCSVVFSFFRNHYFLNVCLIFFSFVYFNNHKLIFSKTQISCTSIIHHSVSRAIFHYYYFLVKMSMASRFLVQYMLQAKFIIQFPRIFFIIIITSLVKKSVSGKNNSKHLAYESLSKFFKILVFSIFYENHLPDRDLNFFI